MSELLRAAYDQGVNFWDSADQYGSHTYLREALKTVPREKVVIMTKSGAQTAAELKAGIDRFRQELGVDYIDILLLHKMEDADWPARMRGPMEVVAEAQERGIVKTKGVSCHTVRALETSAKEPWVEVQLARINPAGARMDADPPAVLTTLRKLKQAGKGVIGMKILGAGDLRGKVDECLQFALAQDSLDCVTIGSESRAEMEDLLRKIPSASVRG
jgi:aryl-alcohol dehydrogenase-like predicted oxidoreductase